MRTLTLAQKIRFAASATLLATVIASCAKPAPTPAPEPAPPPAAPATPVVPEPMPPADVPPADAAPPPTEPTAVPKPAAAKEPEVSTMLAAIPSTKMSVAVDLRYSFDGAVLPGQPVIVHLAAIPRAGGTNLKVSVQQAPGLLLAATPLNVQKATASSVYRQQFSLTRQAGESAPLRVLVRMEMGEDSGFGYFTIPLDAAATEAGTIAQKQDSVKQR